MGLVRQVTGISSNQCTRDMIPTADVDESIGLVSASLLCRDTRYITPAWASHDDNILLSDTSIDVINRSYHDMTVSSYSDSLSIRIP